MWHPQSVSVSQHHDAGLGASCPFQQNPALSLWQATFDGTWRLQCCARSFLASQPKLMRAAKPITLLASPVLLPPFSAQAVRLAAAPRYLHRQRLAGHVPQVSPNIVWYVDSNMTGWVVDPPVVQAEPPALELIPERILLAALMVWPQPLVAQGGADLQQMYVCGACALSTCLT
jgi:hypothetical protein